MVATISVVVLVLVFQASFSEVVPDCESALSPLEAQQIHRNRHLLDMHLHLHLHNRCHHMRYAIVSCPGCLALVALALALAFGNPTAKLE